MATMTIPAENAASKETAALFQLHVLLIKIGPLI